MRVNEFSEAGIEPTHSQLMVPIAKRYTSCTKFETTSFCAALRFYSLLTDGLALNQNSVTLTLET